MLALGDGVHARSLASLDDRTTLARLPPLRSSSKTAPHSCADNNSQRMAPTVVTRGAVRENPKKSRWTIRARMTALLHGEGARSGFHHHGPTAELPRAPRRSSASVFLEGAQPGGGGPGHGSRDFGPRRHPRRAFERTNPTPNGQEDESGEEAAAENAILPGCSLDSGTSAFVRGLPPRCRRCRWGRRPRGDRRLHNIGPPNGLPATKTTLRRPTISGFTLPPDGCRSSAGEGRRGGLDNHESAAGCTPPPTASAFWGAASSQDGGACSRR